MAVELTVGQVAARSGLAVSALHFYERKGLIRSHRTGGNQRRCGVRQHFTADQPPQAFATQAGGLKAGA